MKHSQIQNILESIEPFRPKPVQAGGRGYSIENKNELKDYFKTLSQIPFLKEKVNYFDLMVNKKSLINQEENNKLSTFVSHLNINIPFLLEFLKQEATLKNQENILSFKLPEISDNKGLISTLEEFDKLFSNLFYDPEINANIEFLQFDKGSNWIDFKIKSKKYAVAFSLIASVCWTAAVINKKILEGELIEKQVQILTTKNESLKDLKDGLKNQLDLLYKTESESLEKEFFDKHDNERVMRIRESIKILSELIQKGAEVHPSLMVPEKVSNLFPNYDQLENIQPRSRSLPLKTKKSVRKKK
jgi:hypothetical protein